MKRWLLRCAGLALAVCGMAGGLRAQVIKIVPDPPAPASIAGHLAKARAIAGDNPYLQKLAGDGYWCQTPSKQGAMVNGELNAVTPVAAMPIQVFDNLYMIGTMWDGVYVLKTSAGLVLWDTLDNPHEVKTILIPGMKYFHLDPRDLKLVIVTHGHFDHWGGAKYLQDTYHVPIGMSGLDWALITGKPASDPSLRGVAPPRKDKVLTDGQVIRIGDAIIRIVLTPGHTPATVSSIVPVKDHGVTRYMAMWGGTVYPNSGAAIAQMGTSMIKLKNAATAAGAVGILNTHPGFPKIRERLAMSDYPSGPEPLVDGTANMGKAFDIMHECLTAEQDWFAARQGS